MTERELAKQAADWINATPFAVYPMVRCHRTDALDRWWVTIYPSPFSKQDGYRTDAELIQRALSMGWMPEHVTEEPAQTPMFPPDEETE